MRDIRAIRFEKTGAGTDFDQSGDSAFSDQPDARNLLPEQQHLPAYYQELRQRGQVSMDGVFAILRDLNDRVQNVEGQETKAEAPAPSQNEQDTQE